jgi:hypothetical protein
MRAGIKEKYDNLNEEDLCVQNDGEPDDVGKVVAPLAREITCTRPGR